nr:glycosyltransferase family 4 protein [Chloroflexota bacterium]
MKIALLRDLPQENWPSIEVYANRLASGLRALASDLEIVEVLVQSWSWADRSISMPYGRPASLRTLGLYLSRWVRYPLVLRKVQADIYHILDNSYGHLAFFLEPRRTVVTSHGGTPRSWRRWNPEGPAMWLFDVAFRGMQRAAHVVIVSEYAKQELVSETRYPAERIHVVYHGLEPIFHPLSPNERERQRAALLRNGNRYLLLHVGHSAARKNTEALYRAVAILRQGGWPVQLVRVGGIPTASQARLIEGLGLGPVTTHIAYMENQALPAYYAAADAFIFPSLYEGFGVPLIEAMACGTPIVCSDWALFHEVCSDAAYFADPRCPDALAEAIAQVLANPALCEELRQRGLQRAREFTWERTALGTLAVYRKIFAELG